VRTGGLAGGARLGYIRATSPWSVISRRARRGQALVAVLTAVIAWLAAPLASAAAQTPSRGSIVYVHGGRLYRVAPDGRHRRRLTRSRGWSSPSQSLGGLVVALRRDRLVRLSRSGRPIGRPVPLVGTDVRHSGNLLVQAGPMDLRVSPDGRRAAYWVGIRHQTCDPVTFLCDYELEDVVLVTRVNRFTPASRYGLVRERRYPSWYSSDILLVSSYALLVDDVSFDHVRHADRNGNGDWDTRQWFDGGPVQLAAPVSPTTRRRQNVVAVLAGSNDIDAPQPTLRLYSITQRAEPQFKCEFRAPRGGRFASPTWRPDGRELAWVESDGIHAARIPDLSGPHPACTSIRPHFVARGTQPSWGRR
jgi:hypothetical protein